MLANGAKILKHTAIVIIITPCAVALARQRKDLLIVDLGCHLSTMLGGGFSVLF